MILGKVDATELKPDLLNLAEDQAFKISFIRGKD